MAAQALRQQAHGRAKSVTWVRQALPERRVEVALRALAVAGVQPGQIAC